MAAVIAAVMLLPLWGGAGMLRTRPTARAGGGWAELAPVAGGALPLSFEVNRGQVDPQVQFVAHGGGYTLFLTSTDAVFVLRRAGPISAGARPPRRSPRPSQSAMVRFTPVDAQAAPRVIGMDELPGKANYFIGNDPQKWRTNIPTYARVRCVALYPGIDLVYHGRQGRLEYDFIVAPGADPGRIALRVEGADRMEVTRQGDLALHLRGGLVMMPPPVIYQEVHGLRREIAGGYILRGGRIGFWTAAYDAAVPLVIDPVVVYSTYLGGDGFDYGPAAAVDRDGNAYATGGTSSVNFPLFNPLQPNIDAPEDVYVSKINRSGTALLYSTYLGGNGRDFSWDIAVDGMSRAYVTGSTPSTNFPTASPAQPTNEGGFNDAFVTVLNATGSGLIYSTYFGGSGSDEATGIALDTSGTAYIAGTTSSTNLTTQSTPGGFGSPVQSTHGGGDFDAFVASFDSGGALRYSTYLGGSGVDFATGIALYGAAATVTGYTNSTDFPAVAYPAGPFQSANAGDHDAFVTRVSSLGDYLVYSTYLGGSGDDRAMAVAVDAVGSAIVAGNTRSSNFPKKNPIQSTLGGGLDGFVTKLNSSGSALDYSTYLGGSGSEDVRAVGIDPYPVVPLSTYVAGQTFSSDFPTKLPFRNPAALDEAFITKISSTGAEHVYSSYLGGSGSEIVFGVVAAGGSAFAIGSTTSTDFPTTAGAVQGSRGGGPWYFWDTFLVRVSPLDSATAGPAKVVLITTAPWITGEWGAMAILTNNTGGTPATTVTVESLRTNPGTPNVIDVGGGYVDLKQSGADLSDVIEARFYYPSTISAVAEASLTLLYFTGTAWTPVRSSGNTTPLKLTTDNLDETRSGGRFDVKFDNTSTPRITDLLGTAFTSALTSPTAGIAAVASQVGTLNVGQGIKNSLTTKLTAAEQSLQRGNRQAAVNQLQAFVHEVQGLRAARRIDAGIADAMITTVRGIMHVL